MIRRSSPSGMVVAGVAVAILVGGCGTGAVEPTASGAGSPTARPATPPATVPPPLAVPDPPARRSGSEVRIPLVPRPSPLEPGKAIIRLSGTWQPEAIAGYDGDLRAANVRPPVIEFSRNLTWRAFDGCNWSSGSYSATPDGNIRATGKGAGTLIACDSVPNDRTIRSASTYTMTGSELTLFSATGMLLARYSRVG